MGNFLKSSSQPAKNTSSKARGLHHANNSSERLVDLGGQFSGIKAQRRFTFTEVRRGSEKRKIGLDDFIIMKVLGKGSFGKVCLVRKKENQRLYALKALSKEALLRRNQIAHTETERHVLQHVQHPFLVQLQYAFQSDTRLYMVLEFMAGGELFFWLKRAKRFPLPRAKLYAAEVLLALECLHEHDIVYRDLKPENVLVGADGHVKLTDFGLSKDAVTGFGKQGGGKTFCGTPEYLAPEILENKGHGKAVDWWTLGIMLYEMLNGDPPFYHKNVQQMYSRILNDPLRFPGNFPEDAKSLLQSLLQRSVHLRIGTSERGARKIKNHPFFATLAGEPLEWEKILRKEVTPEFIPPRRAGSIGMSNFDPHFTQKSTKESVVDMTAEQIASTKFEGFSYSGSPYESKAVLQLQQAPRTPRLLGSVLGILEEDGGDEEDEDEGEGEDAPQLQAPPKSKGVTSPKENAGTAASEEKAVET